MANIIQNGLSTQRLAIWLICLVALCICAVSLLGLVQGLTRAYRFDAILMGRLALSGVAFLLALSLFDGARKRRAWSLWPALALFLLIVPINLYRLGDSLVNPPVPPGGFATADEFATQEGPFLKMILEPTRAEFHTHLRRAQAATVLGLALVAFPTFALFRMRRQKRLT